MESDVRARWGKDTLKYAVSPIICLLPIVFLTGFAGDFGRFDIKPEFVVGVTSVYLILSGFYLTLCQRHRKNAAVAVGFITNGMMLIFFSVAFKSGIFFNFLGFSVAIVGIVTGISAATPSGESLFARKIDRIIPYSVGMAELQKIIDAIPFPCVFMERVKDGGEQIVAYNSQMLENFELGKKDILGKTLDSLVTMVRGTNRVIYSGEEWDVKRTVRGRQILVMFSPILRSKEASTIEVFDAIDVATGLYVAGFMKYKAKSDIESVNRGKRKLSAVLLKLTFPPGVEAGITEDERKLAEVIFGRVVGKSIRVCDSGYRTNDDEVLLVMPDTPSSGSKVVISRILAGMKSAAAVECPQCSKAIINFADRDYIGSIDLPSYDKMLSELSVAFYKKYPDLTSGA
ncbi:MAG: hypothetical protein LBS35_02045 [Synergistaceae bacterium]|jgi:hypothetical protein|nr:hypothetical protein [Synergistaceae bacterium]